MATTVHLHPSTARPVPDLNPARTVTPANEVVSEGVSDGLGPRPDDFSSTRVATAPVADPTDHGPLLNPKQGVEQLRQYDRALGLKNKTLGDRWKHMVADPKSFFQANPARFHTDITTAFAPMLKFFSRESPEMPVNNDAHLGNYAWYSDYRTDGLLFGLVDFDTASKTGHPEADVARNAAHVAIIARQQGASRADQRQLASDFAKTYFDELSDLGKKAGEGKTLRTGLAPLESRGAVAEAYNQVQQPRRRDLLDAWVEHPKSDAPTFKKDPEVEKLSDETRTAVKTALAGYADRLPENVDVARPLVIHDIVRKVDSGGSTYGLNRYWALVKGADDKSPRILEVKQELPPVDVNANPDLKTVDAAAIVEAGYGPVGNRPNPLTGFLQLEDGGYMVREVEPQKKRVDPTALGDKLGHFANQAAVALARKHALDGDPAALAAWVGNDAADGAAAVGTFAVRYADQNAGYSSALKDALG